jgi:hypothetical protein
LRAVREDPQSKGLLFAGTEFGVYVSWDDGDHWQSLQLNLPVTGVRDLTIHGDDLVAATFGRSFWILDNITPLRQALEAKRASGPWFYGPATAIRMDNDSFSGTPLPPEEPTAENPPNGAMLDYFLPSRRRAACGWKFSMRNRTSSERFLQKAARAEDQAHAGQAPGSTSRFP